MSSISKFILVCALIGLNGCAHSMHEVHTSDFIPYASLKDGTIVSSRAEQFVVLGFTQNTNYVDEAYRKLLSACPNGALSGITTQIATKLSFFSWTNSALMQGLCLAPKKI